MARIAYALTSQGMGHTSRALVLGEELRRREHELLFLCGGRANQVLTRAGWRCFEVPVTGHLIRDNRLLLYTSFFAGLFEEAKNRGARGAIRAELSRFEPDVLVNDFELYSGPAANELGIRVMTLNHQQVLTHTAHRAPLRHAWHAFVARGVIRHVMPRRVDHTIITTWQDCTPTEPDTTIVGPIIRPTILDARPTRGDFVLVYHNDPSYLSLLIPLLGQVAAKFVVYRPPQANGIAPPPNVELRDYDAERFVEDLVSCRAVISSAGYTLMSECLWLHKPLFAIPNRGQYEQTYNALHLVENGWGEACFRPVPAPSELDEFLRRAPALEARLGALELRPGVRDAADCIQRVIAQPAPSADEPSFAATT